MTTTAIQATPPEPSVLNDDIKASTRTTDNYERTWDVGSENGGGDENDDDETSSCNSSDAALLELLGLKSLDAVTTTAMDGGDNENDQQQHKDDGRYLNGTSNDTDKNIKSNLPSWTDTEILQILGLAEGPTISTSSNIRHLSQTESVIVFPAPKFSIPASYMRRLTDELVWNSQTYPSDKTYETIQVMKKKQKQQGHYSNGNVIVEIEDRRVLTRFERFVDTHPDWSELCHGYLRRLLSAALGMEMVLFKEKLNLKPPGGAGFAPHVDTPSLRVSLQDRSSINHDDNDDDGRDGGPRTFWTVMVAIDDMTVANGCLRVMKGPWDEQTLSSTSSRIHVIQPPPGANPDGDGRAGAIYVDDVDNGDDDNPLQFEDIVVKGGTIVAFNGWVPHRSACNTTHFSRRAVFLTYNPLSEGDFHQQYYERMDEIRDKWRRKVGLERRQQQLEDIELEQQWLGSVESGKN